MLRSSSTALVLLATCASSASAQCIEQTDRLVASDPQAFDWLGNAVAVSGNTLVGGAIGVGVRGAAYVFQDSGTSWVQEAKLEPSAPYDDNEFGTAVAIDGDTIVVGADEQCLPGRGTVYVFTRSGSTWSEQAAISPLNLPIRYEFGHAVGLSADTAAVGCFPIFAGAGVGSVHLFTRSGTSWSLDQVLVPATAGPGSIFGASVAIDGDTLIAGAPYHPTNGPASGAAWIFTRQGGVWVEGPALQAGQGAQDYFGASVAIDGGVAVVCAAEPLGLGGGRESLFVFRRTGAAWSLEAELRGDGEADGFGSSVALDGRRILVGARAAAGPGSFAGAAFLFERDASGWSRSTRFVSDDISTVDQFSYDVALAGDRLFAGSVATSNGEGAVYEFRTRDAGTAYCSATPNSTGAAASTSLRSCESVAQGELVLVASPVPANFGVAFYGPSSVQQVFGDGFLCIGGPHGRLPAGLAQGGELISRLDLTLPQHGQLVAGSTWYFQSLYRDPPGGPAGWNMSRGLALLLAP